MGIQELIDFLQSFPDSSKDVFVHLFKPNNAGEIFEIESISDNNGHVQINIYETDS
jgi:hypothetical protein